MNEKYRWSSLAHNVQFYYVFTARLAMQSAVIRSRGIGGIDSPVLNLGGIIPRTFQAKLSEKLRNMAAIELQTQLEYNAIALSVNDFVTGSSNHMEIFG